MWHTVQDERDLVSSEFVQTWSQTNASDCRRAAPRAPAPSTRSSARTTLRSVIEDHTATRSGAGGGGLVDVDVAAAAAEARAEGEDEDVRDGGGGKRSSSSTLRCGRSRTALAPERRRCSSTPLRSSTIKIGKVGGGKIGEIGGGGRRRASSASSAAATAAARGAAAGAGVASSARRALALPMPLFLGPVAVEVLLAH